MLNFPALDVAIGLVFVYFILALVCSGINETLSTWMRWRAQDLERGLWELLEDPEQGSLALDQLKAHPLIRPMLNPKTKSRHATTPHASRRPKTSRKTEFPSYIPSRTAITALLGLEQEAVAVAKDTDVRAALRKIDKSINAIPSEPVRRALTALLHSAQGDSVAFRRSAEQWFDDHMERVSGWYRRRIQRVLWILAIVTVLALNADTLQMAKRLWVEPSVRAAIVSQAGNAATGTAQGTDPSKELGSLSVPLGWHLATARHDPQGFPFYEQPSMVWALLSKLIGLLLTIVAVTFGAPFWFDLLSKLARIRNSGAPPPTTDATRVGEGEETRRGDSTSLATTLLEVMGKSGEESDADTTGKDKTVPPDTPATDVQ